MNSYEKIEKSLEEICEECKFNGTNQCIHLKCNVGFASEVIKAAKINGQKRIEGGLKLIPKDDMKIYEEDAIAKSVAYVCKLCKECKGNHSEDCIVALSRKSLENTFLKEDMIYPGNVLMYLINVAKQNQSFSDKIKAEYLKG